MTMMTNEEMEERKFQLTLHCPVCSAAPGQSCWGLYKDGSTNNYVRRDRDPHSQRTITRLA